MNKIPREAWELIEGMVKNFQQFATREDIVTRRVNEVNISSLQEQLSKLTFIVRQMAIGNV